MKGLLVKDFKLMKMQKNFFLMFIVMVIGMMAISDDVSFMLGFLTFIISLLALTTISYDEFDNGYAFLFTLPVSRTGYTIEKYCLALLLGGGAWIFATLLSVVVAVSRRTYSVSDIMMIALMILPVALVTQAVTIPFQLKFGGEKGRIAIICTVGLLFVVGVAVVKMAELLGIDLWSILDNLPVVNLRMLVLVIIILAVVILMVSMRISISIMNKKEF